MLSGDYNPVENIYGYYLTKQNLAHTNKRVQLSHLINLFLYSFKSKQIKNTELADNIYQLLQEIFNISLNDHNLFLEKLQQCNSIFDLGRLAPYSLPLYVYTLYQYDNGHKIELLLIARAFALKGLQLDFQNLFIYHSLLIEIESELKHIAIAPASQLGNIKRWGDELLNTIPELTKSKPSSFMSKSAKQKLAVIKTLWKNHFLKAS